MLLKIKNPVYPRKQNNRKNQIKNARHQDIFAPKVKS